MNEAQFVVIGAWIMNAITIIGSILFLYFFYKIRGKNSGLYMIFILNIAGFLFPLMNVLALLFANRKSVKANLWGGFTTLVYHFALNWSTLIGIFAYLVVKKQSYFNTRIFMILGFIVCLAFAVLISLIVFLEVFDVKSEYQPGGFVQTDIPMNPKSFTILYFVIYDGLGILLPTLLSVMCYIKVFQAMKATQNAYIQLGFQRKPISRVLWYCFIQLICFVPGPIIEMVCVCGGTVPSPELALVAGALHRAWGIFNLLVSWFLSPAKDPRINSIVSDLSRPEPSFSLTWSEEK